MNTVKDPLLSVKNIGQRLGMSAAFVYQELSSGRMEHYQFGKIKGRIRISEDQFMRYLDSFSKGKKRAIIQPVEVVVPPSLNEVSRNLTSIFNEKHSKAA